MNEITISLPTETYNHLKRWATLHEQELPEMITEHLRQTVPAPELLPIPPAETDTAVVRERVAYNRLLPILQQTHAGQFVAIYQGQLVDADPDEAALFARIDDRYPTQFVWLARVTAQPELEITLRSPRF